MNETSDEQLMLTFMSGEKGAIEVIFERYKNRILNFCLRLLGNRADAEDVTGDVFLALFAQQYTYQPSAKFSTWLFTIARNSCIDRLRKRKHVVSLWFSSKNSQETEEWDILDLNQNLSRDEMIKMETAKHVKQSISKLPLEQREAIILREYHDFSYAEIAQILGCSLEKIKVLIFRAREFLKGDLSSFIKDNQ